MNTRFVLAIGLASLLLISDAGAQSASVTWPLSSSSLAAPTSTGAVGAAAEIISGGNGPALSVFDYPATGQRLWAGNSGWPASPEGATRFLQFDASPTAGHSLTVNSVSFEYGAAGIDDHVVSNVYYSTDGWTTRTQLNGTALAYLRVSLGVFSATPNVTVPAGGQFSLRIYPYAIADEAAVRQYAVHNTVSISGATQPVTIGDCVSLPVGNVGWWSADDVTEDRSTWANHGALQGGAAYTPGMAADGFMLTTVGDYVTAPSAPQLNFGVGQNFSMDVWVQTIDAASWATSTSAGGAVILHKREYSAGGSWGWALEIVAGHPTFQMSSGTTISAASTHQIDDGAWHLVAVTVDRSGGVTGGRFYVDGFAVETFDVSSISGTLASSADLAIGQRNPVGGFKNRAFGGKIDEVELFDRILTPSEIASIYSAGSAGKCKDDTGTIGGWKYDDADGDGARNAFEAGLEGVVINLLQDGVVVYTTTTGPDGSFSFTVPAGTYTLQEEVPPGYAQTEPQSGSYDVTVEAGGSHTRLAFGNQEIGECVDAPTGLVGWWPGDASTADLSGYADDGTMILGGYATGRVSDAFDLPDVADYVTVPDAPQLNIGVGANFTVDFWIRSTDDKNWSGSTFSDASVVVDKRKWWVQLNGGRISLVIGIVQHLTTTSIDDGNWHFVAVTVDRSVPTGGGRIYIDNLPPEIFNPGSDTSSLASTEPLVIGQRTPASTYTRRAFGGQIDEVELFDRALTSAEVALIYEAGSAGKCKDVPGSIHGSKFNDLDGDGAWDDDEPGLSGVVINLLQDGQIVATTVTDENGDYSFAADAGGYVIEEVIPDGQMQTLPENGSYEVSLGVAGLVAHLDFGNQIKNPCDYLCNGNFDDDVLVAPNTVGYYDESDVQCWKTTAKDHIIEVWGDGFNGISSYSGGQFVELNAFEASTLYQPFYAIQGNSVTISWAHRGRFVLPDEMSFEIWSVATNSLVQSWGPFSATSAAWVPHTETYTFASSGQMELRFRSISSNGGQLNPAEGNFLDDIAISCPAGICGAKFNDVNGNGRQDEGESGLEGWVISLGGLATQTVVTEADGSYCFTDLAPGDYLVSEVYQEGWMQTFPVAPGTHELTLESGAVSEGIDFGNQADASGTIIGTKFNDLDGDGLWDEDEHGMGGVTINLVLEGNLVDQTTTDVYGAYSFSVLPGTYKVQEESPTGYTMTFPTGSGHELVVEAGQTVPNVNFGNHADDGMCYGPDGSPPVGMVLWLPGDDDTNDLSGLGNNGTLNGGATYAAGKVANGFRLTTNADYVSVPDDPSLNFDERQGFSIDFWLNTTSNANIWLVDKRTTGSGIVHGYAVYLLNGKVGFQIGQGPWLNFASTGPSVNDGAMHYIAVTVDRGANPIITMYVDNAPPQTFNPSPILGDLTNTSPLYVGKYALGNAEGVNGVIDEVEIFNRVVSPAEIMAIYLAGAEGKCKDGVGGPCDEKLNVLPVDTGYDHPASTMYAIGGNDGFWSITADPDTTRIVPRPAEVIVQLPASLVAWAPAQPGSQWIGPSQIVLSGPSQDAVGLGTYTYTLEFCIVGVTATRLDFNLSVLADNDATVRLVDTAGNSHPIGVAPANSFSTPVSIIANLAGAWVAGTYFLQVDVHNDAVPPDFTGLNLTGTISGANLYMQKNECCNSDGKITGTKFSDLNGDGKSDGDPGMAGVTIELWLDGVLFATTTTDSQGDYVFDVPPGTYTIRENPVPIGYNQTGPAGGTYTVTVGPGGIVPNQDFFNQAIPCIDAETEFLCKEGGGGRFIQLSLTYTGPLPAAGIHVTSMTPGVSFILTNTPAYPINPGDAVVLNIDFQGLAPGASAQILLNMDAEPDEFGVSHACCDAEITVVRPGGGGGGVLIECPISIGGWVVIDDAVIGRDRIPLGGWVIRIERADGMQFTEPTSFEDGFFLAEGLTAGAYRVSVDRPFGWDTSDPMDGFFGVELKEGQTAAPLTFVMSNMPRNSGSGESADVSPSVYALQANYPNPFNPTTRIRYQLPEGSSVRISVYDMLGREIETLVNSEQSPGTYSVTFDAGNLPSGVYIYRMTAGAFVSTHKMVLMK